MKFLTLGVSMNCLFQVIFESTLYRSGKDGAYFRILATVVRRSLAGNDGWVGSTHSTCITWAINRGYGGILKLSFKKYYSRLFFHLLFN